MKRKHRVLSVLTAASTLVMLLGSAMPAVSAAEIAEEASPAAEPVVTTSPYYPEHNPWITDDEGHTHYAGTNALQECRLEIKNYPQTAFAVGEEFNTNGLQVFLIEQRRFNQKDYDVTPVLNIETDYDANTEGTYTVKLSTDYINGEAYTDDVITYEVTVSSSVTTGPSESGTTTTVLPGTSTETTAVTYKNRRVIAGSAKIRVGETSSIDFFADTNFSGGPNRMMQEPKGIVENLDPAILGTWNHICLCFTGKSVGTTTVTLFMDDGVGYDFMITVIEADSTDVSEETTTEWDTDCYTDDTNLCVLETTTWDTDYYTDDTNNCVTDVTTWAYGDSIEYPAAAVELGKQVTVDLDDLYRDGFTVKDSTDILSVTLGSYPNGSLRATITGNKAGMTTLVITAPTGAEHIVTVYVLEDLTYAEQLEAGDLYYEESIERDAGCEFTQPLFNDTYRPKSSRVTAVIMAGDPTALYLTDTEYIPQSGVCTLINLHVTANSPGKCDMIVLMDDGAIAVYHVTVSPAYTGSTSVSATGTTVYSYTGSYHTGTHTSVSSTASALQDDTIEFNLLPMQAENAYDVAFFEGNNMIEAEPGAEIVMALYASHDPGCAGQLVYMDFSEVEFLEADVNSSSAYAGVTPTANAKYANTPDSLGQKYVSVIWVATKTLKAAEGEPICVFVIKVPETPGIYTIGEKASVKVELENGTVGLRSTTVTPEASGAADIPYVFYGLKICAGCMPETEYSYTGSIHTGTPPYTEQTGTTTVQTGVTVLHIGDTDEVLLTLPYDTASGSSPEEPIPTFTQDGDAVQCIYYGIVVEDGYPFHLFKISAVKTGSADLEFWLNGEKCGYRCYQVQAAAESTAGTTDTTGTMSAGTTLYDGETDRLRFTCVYDEASGSSNTDIRPVVSMIAGDITVRDAGTEYDEYNNPYMVVEVIAPQQHSSSYASFTVTVGDQVSWFQYVIVEGKRPPVVLDPICVEIYGLAGRELKDSVLLDVDPHLEAPYIDSDISGVEMRDMYLDGDRLFVSFYSDAPGEAFFSVHVKYLDKEQTLMIRIHFLDPSTTPTTSAATETTTADGFGTGTYPTAVTTIERFDIIEIPYTCGTDENGRFNTETKPLVRAEYGYVKVSVSDVLGSDSAPYFLIKIEAADAGTDLVTVFGEFPMLLYFEVFAPTTVSDFETTDTTYTTTTGNTLIRIGTNVGGKMEFPYATFTLTCAAADVASVQMEGDDVAAVGYEDTADGCLFTLYGKDVAGVAALTVKLKNGTVYTYDIIAGNPAVPVGETTTAALTTATAPVTSTTATSTATSGSGYSDLPQTGSNDPAARLALLFAVMLLAIGGTAVCCTEIRRRKEQDA